MTCRCRSRPTPDDLRARRPHTPQPSIRPRRAMPLQDVKPVFGSSLSSPKASSAGNPARSRRSWCRAPRCRSGYEDRPRCRSMPTAGQGRRDGRSIAPKGEVNSDNQRAKTPAERLGLFDDKSRAKSKSASPKRCISKPAAKKRCAVRSRSRKSCSTAPSPANIRTPSAAWSIEQAPPFRLPVHVRLRQ